MSRERGQDMEFTTKTKATAEALFAKLEAEGYRFPMMGTELMGLGVEFARAEGLAGEELAEFEEYIAGMC